MEGRDAARERGRALVATCPSLSCLLAARSRWGGLCSSGQAHAQAQGRCRLRRVATLVVREAAPHGAPHAKFLFLVAALCACVRTHALAARSLAVVPGSVLEAHRATHSTSSRACSATWRRSLATHRGR